MGKQFFFACTLLLFLAVHSTAQNSMIRGKVRAANGNTINDALVELRRASGGIIGQTTTRTDGDFAFTGLRAGEYEVVVTLAGYVPTTQVVELTSVAIGGRASSENVGEVMSVEITLRPRLETILAPPGVTFVQNVPEAARASYEKAVIKLREGKSAEGIALLQDAITKFNDYFDALYALGWEYYRQGKDHDALEALERARLINDHIAGVYYMFGLIMARQQKFRLAEYGFAKATELNDGFILAHFNHGVAFIELALRSADTSETKNFLEQAEKALDKAWELSGKHLHTVYLQRARIHQKRGNTEAAARALESYLKAEPNPPNAAALKETIKALRQKK
ncbi:MAG: carboxypeptidase regulatory-like domain-containing protein [Acidobacteriota bacterium]